MHNLPRARKQLQRLITITFKKSDIKIKRGLAKLKASTILIFKHLQRRLIKVVRVKFLTFAASLTILEHNLIVVHTIKAGNAQPFRHNLQPIYPTREQNII